MPNLSPPRHIPTLPNCDRQRSGRTRPEAVGHDAGPACSSAKVFLDREKLGHTRSVPTDPGIRAGSTSSAASHWPRVKTYVIANRPGLAHYQGSFDGYRTWSSVSVKKFLRTRQEAASFGIRIPRKESSGGGLQEKPSRRRSWSSLADVL